MGILSSGEKREVMNAFWTRIKQEIDSANDNISLEGMCFFKLTLYRFMDVLNMRNNAYDKKRDRARGKKLAFLYNKYGNDLRKFSETVNIYEDI